MKKEITTLLIIILICISFGGPVTGQSNNAPDSVVLLDQERTEVGTVSVGGERYTIYRYENTFPYATGIEIFQGNERVTSQQTAEEVLQAHGWKDAVRGLDTSDINDLRSIGGSAQEIESTVSGPLSTVNTVLGEIENLEQTTVPGSGFLGEEQSAWDAATSVSPTLQGFDSTLRTLQSELEEWEQNANRVNENVPQLVGRIEGIRGGEDPDYSSVRDDFSETMEALDSLESQTSSLENRVSTVGSASSTIASEVSDVPVVGEETSSTFDSLASDLNSMERGLDQLSSSLNDQESNLQRVSDNAESTQQSLLSSWETRQSSSNKVLITLMGALLVILVLVGLVVRSYRKSK